METFLTLFGVALGLSMDAFAVSISNSMCYPNMGKRQAIANSACFGLFQGIMPIIGYFAGLLFYNLIKVVDHWIALGLLAFIGIRMVIEGIRALRTSSNCPSNQTFTKRTILVQAVATSIDALAVGISFVVFASNIWVSASVIAVTTFACCLLGVFLGRRFGTLLGDWAQIFGGLLLTFIGLKIFIDHLIQGI